MKYLTYQASRRRPWTEHNCFPKGAIKWWRETRYGQAYGEKMLVFKMSEDRMTITFVPEEDWEE